jgi:heme/copper-type cytochrome/quinol oxidase subunit 3
MTQLVASATSTPVRGTPVTSRKLAVWLFLGSEVLFFSALIFTYVAVRLTSTTWPAHAQVSHVLNIPLTALNTFILIVSSVAVVLALDAAQRGRRQRMLACLLGTLALGVTFLSVQAYEYRLLWGEGLTVRAVPQAAMPGADPLFGSAFYAMTGFHGLHVLGGVLTLLIVVAKAWRGHYTRGSHDGVELFGLYWHFVDLVWIILFTVVYLV